MQGNLIYGLFSHKINTPKGEQRLGGEFKDDEYRYGGVGLRAINGLEMLEQGFYVRPDNARK